MSTLQDPVVALDPALQQLVPPPSTQPAMKDPGWGVEQGPVAASPPPPSQSQSDARQARKNDRAYDPVRSDRSQSRRGRTRGSPNYRPREVEVLLDIVDEELPVGAKGWNVVGARFREWVASTEHPARADRSLEIKYKQVGFCLYLSIRSLLTDGVVSWSRRGSQRVMQFAHPRLLVPMSLTTGSRARSHAGISVMTTLSISMATPMSTTTTQCRMPVKISLSHPLAPNTDVSEPFT